MAKKVLSVGLNKKVMKPVNKRKKLKTLFTKFSNYMKSDTYMFSLLTSPKPPGALPSSSGEGSYEPTIRKTEKNWLHEVEEYLKCDCYMYAPLCYGSVGENPTKGLEQNSDASKNKDEMGHRTAGTMPPRRITTRPTKRVAVKHVLVEREEAVKHFVLQNGGSSCASGKELLQKELGKAGQNELIAGKV